MGSVSRRKVSSKWVVVAEQHMMVLSTEEFTRYRGEGKIMPAGQLYYWYVRKGSRCLADVRRGLFSRQTARIWHNAVQRRKKQARARTGRRS